ncbi:MAG: hypothetical protein HC824_11280 [Synechococcales cyanobacterium RM1_1_8]|nr:hypothetical protein [Synechococcales cyanobacterium RM1_1_8]
MPSVKSEFRDLLRPVSQGQLQDYGTALAWSPQGDQLAIASAAGEVLFVDPLGNNQTLLAAQGQSIDVLQFSAQGRWLAAAGQAGKVYCWDFGESSPTQAGCLNQTEAWAKTWIDQLVWHPTLPLLAFSLGRCVQVWDASAGQGVATLPCEGSSVLGLVWHPSGKWLAVAGQGEIRLWDGLDWDADPQVLEMGSAGVALAVSPQGQYLASGNLDRTLLMWQPGVNGDPWRMQGFSGKVRQLAWSVPLVGSAPLLACASGVDVVIWKKQSQNDEDGWEPRVLALHQGRVEAIAFQPKSLLLASAAADGCLGLWRKGRILTQRIEATAQGFSGLAWHPSGQFLAAAGQAGEWMVWRVSRPGKGFGAK